jgi:hypothetical protein
MSVPSTGHHRDGEGNELHVPGFIQEAEPTPHKAGMLWFRPSTGVLSIRNDDNDGWIEDRRYLGDVTVDGLLVLPNLPETDPEVAGALWLDTGALAVSDGPA